MLSSHLTSNTATYLDQNGQLMFGIAMEYIYGCPLDAWRSCDTGRRVQKVARQALEGLCHLAENGLIHRDIKPRNIILDAELNIKIIDFGLTMTTTGKPSTCQYLSIFLTSRQRLPFWMFRLPQLLGPPCISRQKPPQFRRSGHLRQMSGRLE